MKRYRLSIHGITAFALIAMALLGHCMAGSHPRDAERALRKMGEGRVRVVWCQDIGEGKDLYAEGRQLRLMGFDSHDGMGERPILNRPWSYARPMITPRGDRVIFSSRADDTVYIVNWDGSGLKGLVEGFGLDVWLDPADGREWLYYATDARPTRRQDERKYTAVVRCPIDEPSRVELVWDLLPITQLSENNFQISGDGRRASQHGPDICVVNELPNVKWTPYGKGCWPSIAPDNSYRFWHFDGNHRTLSMYDPGPTNRRTIALNIAPELAQHEVFHPRWSNHPRYLTWAGPKLEPGGGPAMEIYVGRFNEAFDAVEQWVRITHNPFADFCPDLWLESAVNAKWAPPPEADAVSPSAAGESTWPLDRSAVAFLWLHRAHANEIITSNKTSPQVCRVIPRGRARFGRYFEMLAHGGWFEADGVSTQISEQVNAAGAFTFELVGAHEGSASDSFTSILLVRARNGGTNAALGVEGNRLKLRLARGEGNDLSEFDLAEAPTNPTHTVVSWDRRSMVCFLNGQRVFATPLADAGLSWDVSQIIFGDPNARWRGSLDGIALYSRRLYGQEIAANARLAAQRLAQRQPVSRAVVRAKLVEASKLPTPDSISPYRSAMVAHAYDVVEVLEGTLSDRAISAARWAILDKQVQPDAARTVGEVYTLEIEPFEEHPELEGERLVTDIEDLTRPLYYEVDL